MGRFWVPNKSSGIWKLWLTPNATVKLDACCIVVSGVVVPTSVIGRLVVSVMLEVTKVGAPIVVVSMCACEVGSVTKLGSVTSTLVGNVLVLCTSEPGVVCAGTVVVMDLVIFVIGAVIVVVSKSVT